MEREALLAQRNEGTVTGGVRLYLSRIYRPSLSHGNPRSRVSLTRVSFLSLQNIRSQTSFYYGFRSFPLVAPFYSFLIPYFPLQEKRSRPNVTQHPCTAPSEFRRIFRRLSPYGDSPPRCTVQTPTAALKCKSDDVISNPLLTLFPTFCFLSRVCLLQT